MGFGMNVVAQSINSAEALTATQSFQVDVTLCVLGEVRGLGLVTQLIWDVSQGEGGSSRVGV